MGEDIPHVYRVLNRRGEVSEGYSASDPKLPPDPASVRVRLEEEGVRFNDGGRADAGQRWTAAEWAGADADVTRSDAG
jgi:hypothetical protein